MSHVRLGIHGAIPGRVALPVGVVVILPVIAAPVIIMIFIWISVILIFVSIDIRLIIVV